MPFLQQDPDGGWRETREVDLRQLAPVPVRFWARTEFRVLTGFRYAYPGRPPARVRPPDAALEVRAGDTTDLASVPPFLWGVLSSYGSHTMPALLHDRLCAVAERQELGGPALRRWADALFRRMLRDEARAGIATRWAMWSGIRLFSFPPLGVVALAWAAAVHGWWAWTAWAGPAPRWPAIAAVALTALTVLLAVVRAVEPPLRFDAAAGPAAPRSFRPPAAGSLLGAALVALPAVPLFAPVVAVTLAVRGLLLAADLLLRLLVVPLSGLAGAYRRARPAPDAGAGRVSRGDDVVQAVMDEPWPVAGTVFPRP
ncbi:DUF1353 domain-containing protein [Blastococcus sp. SYSU D00820]